MDRVDRREAMVAAAAAIGGCGLSEAMAGDNPPVATCANYGLDMTKIKVHTKFREKPYDAVVVLEAIRTHPRFDCTSMHVTSVGYWTTFYDGMRNVFLLHGEAHEDFATAVRWLHRQAAAVDPAFAEQWPVPE